MNQSTSTYTEIDVFNFTKKVMPFVTFPVIFLVAYYSAHPFWTVFLASLIPLIGYITGELFIKYQISIKEITFPIQLLLLLAIFIVSGSEAPAWIFSISGLAIITIQKMKYKSIFYISTILLTALGNYYGGIPLKENISSIIVLSTVAIFLLRLLQFLTQINEQLQQQKKETEAERKKADQLLLNILPVSIAEELKTKKEEVVKRYENTSILFADLVNFTALSEKLSPQELVKMLNELFSEFDDLTDKYNLEKIKTIGDAYMVAGGVPQELENHANALFQFAQEMLVVTKAYNQANNLDLKIRIGINSGPLVAGVIGKKKFSFDLWGDTVNTAARMEANGKANRIQVSPTTYEILKSNFQFEKIPDLDIKGKGKMDVYLWKGNV